jgi:hypothetical protein
MRPGGLRLHAWNVYGRRLSDSCFSHIIGAPIELVDLNDWLFHAPDGALEIETPQPSVIRVDSIDDSLFFHRYVAKVAEPNHCRLVSRSEVVGPNGRTTARAIWDLAVEPLGEHGCELINHVILSASGAFVALLADNDISLREAASACEAACAPRDKRETSLFATSIEHRALTRNPRLESGRATSRREGSHRETGSE